MKKIAAITVTGLALAVTSLYATAREGDSQRLAGCEAELQQMYGEETSVKLKSLSHKRGGASLRLKVRPAESDSRMVTCRVDKAGAISLEDSQGVALNDAKNNTVSQVSLAD